MSPKKRIHIVGTAGSGKTTLGRELSTRLGIPHIELDALHWGPGWQKPDLTVFRSSVTEALAGQAWLVEGNYSEVRDLVWERVELVVWLDFSLGLCLWRTLVRTMQRINSREELWHGNRESLRDAFFSRDSLLWYVLKTHRRRRRQYANLFSQPENQYFQVVRLSNRFEVGEFIASFTS